MLVENFFNFFNKFHHNSISKYSKNLGFEIMIDVGAHKGEFLSSFLSIKKIKKFYCFEPQTEVFNMLSGIYKKNKKVLLFNIALGEKLKKKKMFLSNLTSTSTMSNYNKNSKWLKFKNFILKNKNQKTIYVKQKSFDQFFNNINLKKSFLKIDVEGYELNVLRGSKKKIKDIKYILIEHQFSNQYKNNFDEVKKFLIKNNFEILKFFYYPTFHFRDILFKKKS